MDLYNLSSSSEEMGQDTPQLEAVNSDTPADTNTATKDALQILMQSRKPAMMVGGSRIPMKGHNKRVRESPPSNPTTSKLQKGDGKQKQTTSLS